MKIQRNRWVITRNDGKDIFCGLARNYQFKPVADIGDTAIKSYLSRDKAIAAFERSWDWFNEDVYKAVEVVETVETRGEGEEG